MPCHNQRSSLQSVFLEFACLECIAGTHASVGFPQVAGPSARCSFQVDSALLASVGPVLGPQCPLGPIDGSIPISTVLSRFQNVSCPVLRPNDQVASYCLAPTRNTKLPTDLIHSALRIDHSRPVAFSAHFSGYVSRPGTLQTPLTVTVVSRWSPESIHFRSSRNAAPDGSCS